MAQTTKYWTWAQIKAKLARELELGDLGSEDFIDETELLGYANDAIDDAEAEIHAIYEDYFLTRTALTLVDGTDTYALPTNIYAMKIRSVIYFSGSNVYEVKRVRDWKKFLDYRLDRANSTAGCDYRYFVVNTTSGTPQITLSPAAYESGAVCEIWHLRNANRLEADADICDIPEFAGYVFDYVREKVLFKEQAGTPKHQKAALDLEATKVRMVETLTAMVPDSNNEIEVDLSAHYGDMT